MNKEDLIRLKKKIVELSDKEKKERDLYLRNISLGNILGPMTGYASIDKPWLKYYNENNIDKERLNCSAYDYMKHYNINNLSYNAINYMGNIITYKELLDKIDEVTKSLINLNVKSGDVVTLIMANIPENIYLFYAINRLGAVANIIDPRLKTDEIIDIVNNNKSKLVIAIDSFMNKKNILNIKKNSNIENIVLVNPLETLKNNKLISFVISCKEKINYHLSSKSFIRWSYFIDNGRNVTLSDIPKYAEEKDAIMVRTGGTTGKPKIVVLSNKNLNEMANQHFLGEYNFNKKDLFLNFLPPFIAYGICGATHMPLVLGLENILIPKFDAKDFPKLMKKYKPNVVFGGPILYEKMMNSKKTKNIDLSSLRVPVSGGDTMNIELENKINKYFEDNNCYHTIGQGYGMTEVSSSACYSKESSYVEGSVGIPLINNSISIFDADTMEEKMINEEGEVCIKTDTMMSGYFNNEIENNNVIKTHEDGSTWVHTGDIGKMNSNGNLFVIGRMKRMIVSNGSKIFPISIESIICKNPYVESCVVVGAEHKALRHVPVAHIVLNDNNIDKEKLIDELNSEIKKELPDYYLPFIYVFRRNMPLTSIDKIDYKMLEQEKYSFKNRIVESDTKKEKRLIKRRI